MRIGGLQKHSFIDYPGKVSCVVFLAGCNFDCPYCHNPQLTGDPGRQPAAVAAEDVFVFLDERRGFLDGVVISGGEPTLHPGLPDFCARIKRLGYSVKLDTNGSRPQVLTRLIREGLVDSVAMDIQTDPERYEGCIAGRCDSAALLASMHLIMGSGLDYEFRTTCVKPGHPGHRWIVNFYDWQYPPIMIVIKSILVSQSIMDGNPRLAGLTWEAS